MRQAKILWWKMAKNRCENVQRPFSIVYLVQIETFTFSALLFPSRTSPSPLPVAYTYLTINNVDTTPPLYIIKISFFVRTRTLSLSLALRTLLLALSFIRIYFISLCSLSVVSLVLLLPRENWKTLCSIGVRQQHSRRVFLDIFMSRSISIICIMSDDLQLFG